MSEKVTLIDPATGLGYRALAGSPAGGSSAGQTGQIVQGQVVSGNQGYAVGTTQILNMEPGGRLKVAVSYAANVVPAARSASNDGAALIAAVYNATRPTWTDGNTGALQVSSAGDLLVANPTMAANQTSGGQRTQIVGPDNSAVPVTGYDTNLVATTKAVQVRGHLYNYDTVAQTFVSTLGNGTGTFVIGKGGAGFVTAQTAVSTTAANVVAARPGRQKVTISLTTSVAFYVGPPGVTATTGLFVPAGGSVTLDTASAIAVVLSTGTATATTADFF